MRMCKTTTWVFLLSLVLFVSCKRKSFDEEKRELIGKCPSIKFFRASADWMDSYILEARYLECRELLDASTLAYGTAEIKQVIARRKWHTLTGFGDCFKNIREGGGDGEETAEPKEPHHVRLGACLRRVMVESLEYTRFLFQPQYVTRKERVRRIKQERDEQEKMVKSIVKSPEQVAEKKRHLEEQKQRDKEKDKQIYRPENPNKDSAATPREARRNANSTVRGSIGVGSVTASLFSTVRRAPDHELPVDKMDWDWVCRFTLADLGALEHNGDPDARLLRAPIGEETLRLMSKECHRLAEKIKTAARTDRGYRNLAIALFIGEELPQFQQAIVSTAVAALEDGRSRAFPRCGAYHEYGDTDDLSCLLGDSDPDGATVDGGFGGGAGGGGAGGGGLGIGGGGGTGWGGIGIGGGLGGQPGPNASDGRRGVSMREGAAQVVGKLDPNEVRSVIRAHRNEVHHCYQKGLVQNDKLAGNVRVVFLINPAGRAQECRVEENVAVAEVGNCICGRLTTWRFPLPEGGLAKVSYRWTLQPGG